MVLFQLSQGTLLSVSPSLIKRRKTHFHNLPCGATVVLGNNGYIWICPTEAEDKEKTGGYEQNLEVSCPESEINMGQHFGFWYFDICAKTSFKCPFRCFQWG